MKKCLLCALALVLLCALLCACGDKGPEKADFKTLPGKLTQPETTVPPSSVSVDEDRDGSRYGPFEPLHD